MAASHRIETAELVGAREEARFPSPFDEMTRNPPFPEPELGGARQRIRLLEAQVEDLQRDRNGWRLQAEVAQAFLNRRRSASHYGSRRPWVRLVWGRGRLRRMFPVAALILGAVALASIVIAMLFLDLLTY